MKGLIIFVALICVSCTMRKSDFAIKEALSVECVGEDRAAAEILMQNNSADTLTLRRGTIRVNMNRGALLTLELDSVAIVPPRSTTRVSSMWRVQRDDPATLYTLSNRPMERYIDKITIDYSLSVELRHRNKSLKGRGVEASRLNINFENLL